MTKNISKIAQTLKKIEKRDGRIVDFNQDKIKKAIHKALTASGEGDGKESQIVSDKVVSLINKRFKNDDPVKVEEIQDIVEEALILENYVETAKAYILYREQHRRIRESKTAIDESLEMVDKYIGDLDWQIKENANMAFSLQGLHHYIVSAVSKKYWLNKIYPKEIREAINANSFHVHDLDFLGPYCCGWDLFDLLYRGFGGVVGKVESKPAKHLRTALGQLVNFFYTLQGESAGAQAISNFDTLLAPFIRHDNLTYQQVKQAIQEFIFNCAIPTRVGFQTPFLNVTLDIKPPKHLINQPVIIGGEAQEETYGEFQDEMNVFNRAFTEVMIEGDAKGRIFTFPIPTYNITNDFDWNNQALHGIWELTAKYGVPYFANFINSEMSVDDARSMCPLAGDEKVLVKSSRGRVVEYSEIRNIYEGNSKQEEYEIYSDGKFVRGKFNKFENQKMLKVILENGHEIKMSDKHLNFIMNSSKDKKESVLSGEDLKSGMYLPYSLQEYKGEGGNEELGYFVGAYAGDGSFDGDGTVVFSLENHYKKEIIEKLAKIAGKYFGAHSVVKEYEDSKLVSLKVHSKAAVGLCKDFVAEKKREKHYNARIFTTSVDFRKNVLKGHYATDGGNRNRIYTSSIKMVETLNMLAATLGTTTSIYKDERDNRFGKEPNYAVLIYQLNRKNYGDIWFKQEKRLWVKIKEIKPIANNSAYCFEVLGGKPVFTVGTTGILTHNCRLRLDNRELYKRGGGLFASAPLTGSIGVVTINLPQIGYLSKTKKEFFERLANLMDLARDSLEIKRKALDKYIEAGLYPYSKHYLSSVKKMRGTYWANHFSTIGLVGVNEALLNFIDKDLTTSAGQKFGAEILDFMRDRLIKYQQDTDNLYNLEATPAEGTSYRLAKKDKEKYPDIITAGEKEPYYTNSSQLPVGFSEDLFAVLDLQDNLQTKYTGGTVLHAFLGERITDPEMIKTLLKKVFTKYRLPYFTFSPTFSVCPNHGYIAGEHFICPKCLIPQNCEVYSRIVGYYQHVRQWHPGKQEEFRQRKMFVVK